MSTAIPGRRRFSVRPTPRAARAMTSLRLPAFWVLVAVLAAGAARLAGILQVDLMRFPVATTVAIVLFALYAVPFWLFIASMDFLEREPPLLMATAFAWGGVVATTAAIPGNQALHDLMAKLISPTFAATWGPALASPTIEELLKSLGIVMVVLVARKQINSVLDGMVYGALVGLGFQVVENVIYAVNAVALTGQGDVVDPVLSTFLLRGFLSGLWSHTLFSALAGAGIAWFVVRIDRPDRQRRLGLVLGLGMAWLMHFGWNSPLLADGVGSGATGLLLGLLIKGLPALLMVLTLVWVARHREAGYYVAQLATLNDPAVATVGELETLGHGHLRAGARRHAKARAGRAAERAVRALQSAQARLAVEVSRVQTAGPSGTVSAVLADEVVAACRQDVLIERARLEQLGHPEAVGPPYEGLSRALVYCVVLVVSLFLLTWFAISSLHAA